MKGGVVLCFCAGSAEAGHGREVSGGISWPKLSGAGAVGRRGSLYTSSSSFSLPLSMKCGKARVGAGVGRVAGRVEIWLAIAVMALWWAQLAAHSWCGGLVGMGACLLGLAILVSASILAKHVSKAGARGKALTLKGRVAW